MIQCLSQWNLWIGWGFHTFLLYTTFAARDLARHSRRVFAALKQGKLLQARQELSKMVGRDTETLDEKEVIRSSVESVAENTVDGVISPLFYALIGGAPLAIGFKAASTLDSMVGHKIPRYLQFGWASARLDDLLNFIPARISIFLFPVASLFCNLSVTDSLRIVLRDGQKSPSPNAGIPEAAVAGALGVQLGGMSFYKGVARPKPLIGDPKRELAAADILITNRLMITCAVLFLVIGAGVRMWIR
jgi:adenosylcobinamide-phosphate synthase